ncbi:MAG: metallophosphoesterase [Campylobacterota bacterium]|nr:metallophosphoesterase [Campylobacterota bacterium]
MHYVIGDVHGYYKTLLALVDKLPQDSKLIFVGDLIDRGSQSAEVVKYIRENRHLCVMGNHEELMFTYGFVFIGSYENNTPLALHNLWYSNGGIDTLHSYGVVKLEDGKPVKIENFEEPLQHFKDDLKWMEQLPLYIELNIKHPSGKPVVISHAPIDSVWGLLDTLPTAKAGGFWL